MIYVISTGFAAPTKQRCLDSVQCQTAPHQHIYVEASTQHPSRSMLQNIYEEIHKLPKDAIVASLDGDDWLAGNGVLHRVMQEYVQHPGTWLTYGSFVHSDGRAGFAAEHTNERYRQSPWLATHLKTFRAGLFQLIKREDLFYEGNWQDRGCDIVTMWPMMEMAGPARIRFIPDVLYVYNFASSFEHNALPGEMERERKIVNHVRSLSPYSRVESL